MIVFTKSKGVTMMLDLCRFPHLSDANFMTTAKLWMFWIWPNGSETCCNQACTFQSHLNPGSNQSRLLVQDRASVVLRIGAPAHFLCLMRSKKTISSIQSDVTRPMRHVNDRCTNTFYSRPPADDGVGVAMVTESL